MATRKDKTKPTSRNPLPVQPIDRWLAPVNRFMHIEATSGILLILCAATALAIANSPYAKEFAAIWKMPIVVLFNEFTIANTFGHLIINDGLMTIFFFVIGLEVKRELVHGELRDPKKALLPIVAALGGMVGPALVYLAFQWSEPGQRGWAIPMATDIAFVVGLLALFGDRVPFSLKIFLLTLAIVDDLGAVLVIAFVLTEEIAFSWLLAAGFGFVLTYSLNLVGVRKVGVYVVVGIFIWLSFLKSGVHPTVAGVLLGLLTPAKALIGNPAFVEILQQTIAKAKRENLPPEQMLPSVERLSFAARETIAPVHRLETALHPWVAFFIMPIFALANAGVPLDPSAVREPVALAVSAGLVLGKPLGILAASTLAVSLGWTRLPEGVTWRMIAGGACLAGIGFTMALFINTLAFPVSEFPEKEAAGKIGVLAGSLVSGLLGSALLAAACSESRSQDTEAD